MTSLLIRNLIFTVLQPGIVAGYIPYLIVRDELNGLFESPMSILQYLAILTFLLGFTIMMICILSFAFKGKGTLSPADPTKKLVITGLYKYSRNPMYIGVMLMLVAEAIFFDNRMLTIYSFGVFLLFNLFILLIEEPRLKRDFKEEYAQYCQDVRRWL